MENISYFMKGKTYRFKTTDQLHASKEKVKSLEVY